MDKQKRTSGKKRNRRNQGRKSAPSHLDQAPHFDPDKLMEMADVGDWNAVYDASVLIEEEGKATVAFRDASGQEIKCVLSEQEAALLTEGQTAVRVYLEEKKTTEEEVGPKLEASILKARYLDNFKSLEASFGSQERVNGVVLADTKGGFSVALGAKDFDEVLQGAGIRAFLPRRDASSNRLGREEIRGIAGEFHVKELDVAKGNVVVSRKVVASELEAQAQAEAWSRLEEDQVVVGQVKNIVRYGAFVSLNGIDALLHQNDLVWDKNPPVHEAVRLGQTLELKVLEVNPDEKRLRVGLKQMTPDPFELIKEKYEEGTQAHGTVVALTDFGAFVKMPEDIEGLIHVSEISWERVKHPQDHFEIGQEVDVMVLGMDSVARKLSLSAKALQKNPVEKIAETYPEGTRISTSVKSIVDFGVFVSLDAHVDGLVHIGELSWTQRPQHPSEILEEGDEIEIIVMGYDTQRQRVSCSYKRTKPDPFKEWEEKYKVGQTVEMTVTRFTDRGAIEELDGGLVVLCANRDLSEEKVHRAQEATKIGATLEGVVTEFDRRHLVVNISVKRLLQSERKEAYQAYLDKQDEDSNQRMTLGDALKAQLPTTEDSDA